MRRSPSVVESCLVFAVCMALSRPASAAGQSYDQQVRTLCASITDKLVAANKKSIAVVDFTDLDGNVMRLGRFLAEEVSVALASQAKGFEVIERNQLKVILQEHKLSASGIIDPQTARQLGRIAGAEAIVTGSLTPFGDSVRMSVKVLDADTARMLAAATTDIPKTKAIEELLSRDRGDGVVGAVATIPAPEADSRRAGGGAPVTSKTVGQVTVDVTGCYRTAANVRCDLRFLNTGRDNNLLILGPGSFPVAAGSRYDRTRAYDDLGNEYRMLSATLGNNEWGDRGLVEAQLITGVPVPATLLFGNVTREAKTFSAIYLRLNGVLVGELDLRRIPLR